jgi:hypothetical protein
MTTKTKDIPAAALRFAADAEFGEADAEGRVPARIKARSKQPVNHWYWGRVVHDLAGMKAKPTVPIDYNHDPAEVLGFADQFDTSEDLDVAGYLVPFSQDDRASEVIHKRRRGVPYEASINFMGEGVKVQELAPGEVATVNGFLFEGPGAIIREWPLRGIALCPYGVDPNTAAEFSAGHTQPVTVFSQEPKAMPEATPATSTPAIDTNQAAPATPAPGASETTPAEPTNGTPATPPTEPTNATPATPPTDPSAANFSADPRAELKRYMAAFGDTDGARYFAEGKTYEQAQTACIERLRNANKELATKLGAVNRGASTPANFSAAPAADDANQPKKGEADPEKVAKFSATLGDGLGKVAAAQKLPGR